MEVAKWQSVKAASRSWEQALVGSQQGSGTESKIHIKLCTMLSTYVLSAQENFTTEITHKSKPNDKNNDNNPSLFLK